MARISSFEKFPQAYEAWFDVHKLVYQDEVKTAKALVGNRTNGLEIGIGSGKFALPMGIEVGIEPSGQMRKIAQSKGLTVIDAVAEDLPFEAETFDYAAMITVVCFVDDLPKALEEAYRVIKSGGFVLIGLVDKDSELGKAYQAKKDKSKFYSQATFYSLYEMISLSREAGFTNCLYRGTPSTNFAFVFLKCFKA